VAQSLAYRISSGEGKDIELFSKRYEVIGSDNSEIFVNIYNENHRTNPMLLLDAASLKLSHLFDCIY